MWLDTLWVDAACVTLDQLGEPGFAFRTYLDGLSRRTSPTGMRCVAVLRPVTPF